VEGWALLIGTALRNFCRLRDWIVLGLMLLFR
jgi:hypothetical protein